MVTTVAKHYTCKLKGSYFFGFFQKNSSPHVLSFELKNYEFNFTILGQRIIDRPLFNHLFYGKFLFI